MQKIIDDLQGCSRPEVMPKLMGRSITMMISPVRGVKKQGGSPDDEEDKEA
jgi:translation initiation factor IF-3